MFFICYIPELYANYKNQNVNLYNLPEKVLVIFGTGFAFSYALMNGDTTLIINYGSLFSLDTLALIMRAYYVYKNTRARTPPAPPEPSHIGHTEP
jgi:hypothetical protein